MPFVPLTPDEKKQWAVCTDPQHKPPNVLLVTEPMKWVCPACGASVIVRPAPATLNVPTPDPAPWYCQEVTPRTRSQVLKERQNADGGGDADSFKLLPPRGNA